MIGFLFPLQSGGVALVSIMMMSKQGTRAAAQELATGTRTLVSISPHIRVRSCPCPLLAERLPGRPGGITVKLEHARGPLCQKLSNLNMPMPVQVKLEHARGWV